MEIHRALPPGPGGGLEQGGASCTAAARIPGVYVPSLYEVTYHDDGTVAAITPLEGAPARVTKRIVQDLDKSLFPGKDHRALHRDRPRPGDAGAVPGLHPGLPVLPGGVCLPPGAQPQSPSWLVQQGMEACKDSGYQEMTLVQPVHQRLPWLLEGLCDDLLDCCEPHGISLSLPSLRADNFSMDLMERLQQVRKAGLTFAPEAGTQRLRDAINKNRHGGGDPPAPAAPPSPAAGAAVKLYFMLGLPTETDEDVLGIADLAEKVYHAWRECTPNPRPGA